jgi:hypothetical protein
VFAEAALLARAAADITPPPGFLSAIIATGLDSPTGVVAAPDGRCFIALQGGRVLAVDGPTGIAQAAPVFDFAAAPGAPTLDVVGERGLLAVTVDADRFLADGRL